MRLYQKLVGCTCLVAYLTVPPTVSAQNLNGIINMMGNIIEQDMRNQEERRRIETEQRMYRQRQQAIAREEQARLDAIRREEVALIKRLQTALTKLGFYKSKIDGDRGPSTQKAEALFTAAFGTPPIPLTDTAIFEIEQLAEQGFQSSDELRVARNAGFRTRQDYVDATRGGFENARDFSAARDLGFTSFDDFRRYRLSGYSKPEDYRIAAKAGFQTKGEFDSANALGFADRALYDDFKRSGLKDKAAFDAAKAAKAVAVAAGEKCKAAVGANALSAMDACLEALVSDAEKSSIQQAISRIGDELKTKAISLEVGVVNSTSSMPGSEKTVPGAAASSLPPLDLDRLRQQLVCAQDYMQSEWSKATKSCAPLSISGESGGIQKLQAIAANYVAVAEEVATKAEQERKAAALAEQRRLALESARARLASIIAEVGAFTEAKRSLKKPLDVARIIVRLRQLEGSSESEAIEQALLGAELLLKDEPDFQKFQAEKQQANQIAQINARASALAEIRRTEAFIAQFVSANLLNAAVNDLLQLQEKLVAARASGQDEQIFHVQKLTVTELERLKLASAFKEFVFEENSPTNVQIQQSANGLAITNENRLLLDGAGKDVVALGNFSPSAPHLIVNLLGATNFEKGQVDLCWIGSDPAAPPLWDHVKPILKRLGAENIRVQADCRRTDYSKQDVVIIERGEFLNRDLSEARPIVESFEANQLRLIHMVEWSKVGEADEAARLEAAKIEEEVMAGLRKGFGLMRVSNSSKGICFVTDASEQEFHERALTIKASLVEQYLSGTETISAMSLDRAFTGLQKGSCAIVYAKESELAQLIEATKRIQLNYTILPVWIEPQMIAEGRALANASKEEKEKAIAARKQELEASAALAKKKNEDAAVVRAKQQAELRKRYSQESRTAYNEISSLIRLSITGDSIKSESADALFPELRDWRTGRSSQGWQVDKYDDELVDYGTADWKGRRLEAIFIKTNFISKNAIRGEYVANCFVLGYLIDGEFDLRRDAIVRSCENGKTDLPKWQASRAFESRWIAP